MSKKERAGMHRPDEQARTVARMLRVSPQKLNLVAQLIHVKKAPSALADVSLSRASAKGNKLAVTSLPRSKRARVDAKQVRDSLRLVEKYKRAGYDISGTTSDGVVIVKPAGAPDSFNLNQLDRAFSEVNSKY
jgi:ribosomal protein L22